jgi:hypothetical protein
MQVFILEDMSGDEIAKLGKCIFFSEEQEGGEIIGVYAWHSIYGYVVIDNDDTYPLGEFTKAMPISELYMK